MPDLLAQQSYRCRLLWGRDGTREAAARGDILVIVDTLSFSTAVATAVAAGALIYPCSPDADVVGLGQQLPAEVAVGRRAVPAQGRFSLSPQTYLGVAAGTRVVLPSPNGATCSRYAAAVPYLFAGALVNAAATARAVARVLGHTDHAVTVIAAGERRMAPGEDGRLRFAVEDYLGAGAILAALDVAQSPEARVCAGAFRAAVPDLAAILADCESGRELRDLGFAADVTHAARLNLYDSAPFMQEGFFRPFLGTLSEG